MGAGAGGGIDDGDVGLGIARGGDGLIERTLTTGATTMGNPAREVSAFSSPVMRPASSPALCSLWTPPQDFHDVACLGVETVYMRMGCTRRGLAAVVNGRPGSQRS